MQISLFGPRCLVERYKPKSGSKILIPDVAQNQDSHRTGIVRFIGDGRVKGQAEPARALVKPGDVVMFQINHVMEATQKFVCEGRTYMNLRQDELIARFTGEEISVDNMEMLGDYVLLKHFVRREPGNQIIVPDDVVRQSAPDFIYFKCIKKGSTVDCGFELDDELIVNLGRLTPMFIVKRNEDGTSTSEEYCYTRKEWVDGVVTEAEGAIVP